MYLCLHYLTRGRCFPLRGVNLALTSIVNIQYNNAIYSAFCALRVPPTDIACMVSAGVPTCTFFFRGGRGLNSLDYTPTPMSMSIQH